MNKTLMPFNIAEYLDNEEMIEAFIQEALSHNDAQLLARALGEVAKARGMSAVAEQAGLTRASLYKSLSGEIQPSADTVMRVIDALGLRLSVSIKAPKPRPS